MANKNVIWCDKKTLEKNLNGKVYIVTGANSGVGFETTQQLIKQGAHVVMACRRVGSGKEVAKAFSFLEGTFEVQYCDLTDLQSVRDFVDAFLNKHNRLDGLACNAGFVNMNTTPDYTKDGFETTIAASYIGHFLMTELLLETLKETEASRVLILSSVVHAGSPKKRYQVHLDDINWKKRKFNNMDAYCEAKVATALYALELSDRLKETDVTSYSVHPGWARSNFGSGGNAVIKGLMAITKPIFRLLNFSDSSWESAQTSLHCLLSDEASKHSGAYFSQHSVLYRDKECKAGGWPMKSPNPHANDLSAARKMVAMSYEMVGLN